MPSSSSCPPSADNVFGPWAGQHCRGGFDFTLLFEETILIIPLASIFILTIPWRIWHLSRQRQKVVRSPLQSYKAVATIVLVVVQLTLLVLWSSPASLNIHRTKASIAAAALALVASVGICLLSWYEHLRSVRPSALLDLYLFFSVLFEVAHVRTLWLIGQDRAIPIVSTCAIAARCVMLTLESYEKRAILETQYKSYPPESICGPFNRGVFWWLSSLFLNGYNNILTLQDLFPLKKSLYSEKLQDELGDAWDRVVDKKKPGALFFTWCWTQKWTLAQAAIPRIIRMGFVFAQPFMVQRGVEFAATPETGKYNNTGYGLIGAYLIVYGGIGILTAQYEYIMWGLCVKMRGAVVSNVFRKTLTLKTTNIQPAAALTLVSTDIETATPGIVNLNETWAAPIELGLAIYLLSRQLGIACVIPVSLALVTLGVTGAFAVRVAPSQKNWNAASQKRVAQTSFVLGNIKWLKMCGLTSDAFDILHKARIHEMEVSEIWRKLMAVIVICSVLTPVMTPVLTFTTYIGLHSKGDQAFTVTKAFTSMSLFALLARPLSSSVMCIPLIAGAIASFGRLQEYLNIEPRQEYRKLASTVPETKGNYFIQGDSGRSTEIELAENSPRLDNANIASIQGRFKWNDDQDRGINVPDWKIQRNTYTILLGPVGSGKSTVLKCLLGELTDFEGTVEVSSLGTAYCDQVPWLPNGTVRDLITGKLDMDQQWYQTVIKACALEEDISQWERGDQSLVGSKGISVSGGQKQRLCLARAVYSRRELIVLDDNFAGLDSTTSNEVFHNLLGSEGLLRQRGRTVVAASSDAHQAPYADNIILLDASGTLIDQGSFKEVSARQTHLSDFAAQEVDQRPRDGQVGNNTTSSLLKTTELPKAVQTVFSEVNNAAASNRQTGDSSVYAYYLKSAGRFGPAFFIVAMSIYAFCEGFPSIWLKWWTEANAKHHTNSGKWLGVYAALSVGAVVSLLAGAWQIFIITLTRSGIYFHKLLVDTVSSAPMSFFSTVDSGITINRFSQDLQLIDMELPESALSLILMLVVSIAQAVLMSVASRYLAIVFPFMLMVFYVIQRFYLRTSRQMRFLDIEHKAPLYSQLMEIFTGLPTIRAFNWETETLQHTLRILDDSQRPVYLLYVLQRWLILAVDITIALMAVILITLTTTLRAQIGQGYMGIALTNVMGFGATVEAVMITWVMVEIAIGAVARIKNFVSDTESEDKADGTAGSLISVEKSWPESGAIEIRNITASYYSTGPILKNISLSIRNGEKIGLCGRTGSGKSSFVSCLLRLLSIDEGSILIDGIDITTIPHEEVRRRLVAVPQEPYIFEESLRMNMDPSHASPDDEIISALRKVQLWDTIEPRGGLDASIDPDFFSLGQRRLFGLARALLRKSKVLILDEVTTGLDHATADLIDSVVNQVFAGWTIISVAHRLESIMHFDRVIVLDNGNVLEFDDPQRLLASTDSAFRKLVDDSRRERRTTVLTPPSASASSSTTAPAV